MTYDAIKKSFNEYQSLWNEGKSEKIGEEYDSRLQQAWYEGQALGGFSGALCGLQGGAYIGWHTAEPVYQAIEASVPEAGPIFRLAGYSVPAAQAGIYGILILEGGKIGTELGRHAGKYTFGGLGAMINGAFDEFDKIEDYLEDRD